MENKLDLSSLSPEEQEKIRLLIEENKQLHAKVKTLNETVSDLLKVIIKEKHLIKNYNLERYVSKADLPDISVAIREKRKNGLPSTIVKEKKKPGRKKGTENFGNNSLEELSREREPITLDIAEKLRTVNPNIILKKIDETTSFLIKRVREHVVVYKVIMPKYIDENGAFHQETLPTPIHRSMIDASLLSDSIAMKYFMGVPEYRYEKWLSNERLNFTQKTINNRALQSASVLEPFYIYLKSLFSNKEMAISNINIDETWLDVIQNKKIGRDKNYVFCYSAMSKHGKLPLFEYSPTREINNVEAILKEYNATVTVDGYTGYNALRNNGIKIQRCMVHARHEFANIVKTLKTEELDDSVAYKIVNLMDRIFHVEKEMRDNNLTAAKILKNRKSKEYKALKKDLEDYIKSIDAEENSPLDKAIKYYIKMKGEQWTYLKDGNVTLDNNEAERQAKKFVIDRKNFLFSRSEKGANASCILLTMIDLAYVNETDPRAYLELLLNNVTKRPFDELLPWSKFIKENIKKLE